MSAVGHPEAIGRDPRFVELDRLIAQEDGPDSASARRIKAAALSQSFSATARATEEAERLRRQRASIIREIRQRVDSRLAGSLTAEERRQIYLLENGRMEQYLTEFPK